ncbi:hypothetical protein B0H17DRAFT_1126530 [Mycena rosella]|uniref:Uncharacterized protein n=1 Tax=Mycena rosella TaxID=1033263 RepID=A0AAD7M7J7_MYCRO|nr:hypothetical protein B0H17DRAFT_1126530 [Mycena rosella]
MNAKDVVREYLAARRTAFKAETIVQAWAKSGVDRDLFSQPPPRRTCPRDIQNAPNYLLPRTAARTMSLTLLPTKTAMTDKMLHPTTPRATVSPFRHPTPFHLHLTGVSPGSYQYYGDSESDEDDGPPSDLPAPQKLVHYRHRNQELRTQRTRARTQRDAAAAHAILAGEHTKLLQGQLNAKQTTTSGGRVVHTQSLIVTTAQGRAEALKQKEVRDEKNQKAEDLKNKKEDAAAATRRRRADLTRAAEGRAAQGEANPSTSPQRRRLVLDDTLNLPGPSLHPHPAAPPPRPANQTFIYPPPPPHYQPFLPQPYGYPHSYGYPPPHPRSYEH